MGEAPLPCDRDYHHPAVAEHYARRRWTDTAHARRTNRREQWLVRVLLDRCGRLASALDVPCGAGRFLPLIRERAELVVAADLALPMLGMVPGKRRIQASAGTLPFCDGAFELVFCFRLLHHFPGSGARQAVLAELARVARRFVLVSYFDRCSLQAWRNRLKRRTLARFPQSHASFSAEAAAAGLRVAARCFVARGLSEQVVALLEKHPSR